VHTFTVLLTLVVEGEEDPADAYVTALATVDRWQGVPARFEDGTKATITNSNVTLDELTTVSQDVLPNCATCGAAGATYTGADNLPACRRHSWQELKRQAAKILAKNT
jgi:hypothetical protein